MFENKCLWSELEIVWFTGATNCQLQLHLRLRLRSESDADSKKSNFRGPSQSENLTGRVGIGVANPILRKIVKVFGLGQSVPSKYSLGNCWVYRSAWQKSLSIFRENLVGVLKIGCYWMQSVEEIWRSTRRGRDLFGGHEKGGLRDSFAEKWRIGAQSQSI